MGQPQPYEPPLVRQLNHLHDVLESNRTVLASGLFAAGLFMLLSWFQLLEGAQSGYGPGGYPALGVLVVVGAALLVVFPEEKVAALLMAHVRFVDQYLSMRDHHWLRDVAEEYPELKRRLQPLIDSRFPVRIDALRRVWVQLRAVQKRRS